MADQNYTVEVSDKVAGSISQKLEHIAAGARSSYDAVEKLKTALASIDSKALTAISVASSRAQRMMDQSAIAAQRLATETQRTASAAAAAGSAQQRLAQATAQAQTASARLATAQQQTATATANAAAASSRAQLAALRLAQAQNRVQNATNGANNALLNYIKNGVRLTAAGFGARAILGAADAFTTLQNKLQVVSDSESQVADLTNKLFEVANKTRAPVEETATAFTRFDRALANLGASQQESLRLTETVNKSLIVSGATSGEAAAGLLQLSQAFNKGKLDGDEFRTVMELMPSVADAIAKQMKVTRGELLLLAPQGKITADVMRRAFAAAADDIDAKFGKTIPTLSQSVTVFKNNFTQALGELNKSIGFTAGLSKAIVAISTHLREISVGLVALGAGMLVAFGPAILGAIGAVATAAKGLMLVLIANPVILLATAVAGLITWLVLFRDKSELAKEAVDNLGFALDAIVGTFRGIGIFIGTFVAQSVSAVVNIVKESYNKVIGFVEDSINFVIGGINKLKGFVGAQEIELVKFEKLKTEAPEWTAVGKLWAESLDKGFEQQGGAIQKFLNGDKTPKLEEVHVTARKIQTTTTVDKDAEKRSVALAKVNLQLDNEIDRLKMLQPVREAQARFDQIEETLLGKKIKLNEAEAASIRSKIDTIIKETQVQVARDSILEAAIAPSRDYNNTLEAAKQLLDANKISQVLYNNVVFEATEAKKNALDPYRQINKELEQENRILQKLGPQREIQQRLEQMNNQIKEHSAKLIDESTGALTREGQKMKEKLETQQALNRIMEEENVIYSETIGAQEQLGFQILGLNQALQDGIITLDNYSRRLVQIGVDAANLKLELGKGDFNDVLISSLGSLVDNYKGTLAGLSDIFGNFFQTFSDGFANSIGRAIVFSENLGQALRNVAKDALSQLIAGLVKLGIQWVIQAALGNAIQKSSLAAQTAASIAAASATAAAWAPAAAMVSLASFGANAAPAITGIAATTAVSQALSQIKLKGFQSGGFTGNGPIDEVAGAVHRKEFVMDAGSTQRIGTRSLEALRTGAAQVVHNSSTVNSSTGGQVNVKIENHGTSKNFEVQQLSPSDIRIIARDEANKQITKSVPELVAGEIANPNSKVSKSISKNTQAPRRR